MPQWFTLKEMNPLTQRTKPKHGESLPKVVIQHSQINSYRLIWGTRHNLQTGFIWPSLYCAILEIAHSCHQNRLDISGSLSLSNFVFWLYHPIFWPCYRAVKWTHQANCTYTYCLPVRTKSWVSPGLEKLWFALVNFTFQKEGCGPSWRLKILLYKLLQEIKSHLAPVLT